MNEVDKAFAAGLLEGEGSFNIIYRTGQGIFRPVVTFSNNNPLYHLWLQERFGGYIKKHPRSRNRSLFWSSKGPTRLIVEAILPYLIGKKREAEIVYELLNSFTKSGIPSKLSFEQQFTLYNEIKSIHNQEYAWAEDMLTDSEEEVSSGINEDIPL